MRTAESLLAIMDPKRSLQAASESADEHSPMGFTYYLTQEGILERPAVERALRAARTSGERPDRVLSQLGLISESDLAAALARYLSIPLLQASGLPTEPILPEVVSPEFVRRARVMPLELTAGVLGLGMTDPFDRESVRALAFLTGTTVRPRLFTPAEFDKAYETLYARNDSGGAVAPGDAPTALASDVDVQRLRDMASEAPTIRLVNQIIASAVEADASDIHVEPDADGLAIRTRVDGVLRTTQTLASELRAGVTSRIKIMARLDIAERRLPQDGRIKIAIRGVDVDLRVSTIPTVYGESVVLRILDRTRVELDFAKLGFDPQDVDAMRQLLQHPNGIVLVTGPTGSGKTTTLYTALKVLNSADRKLISVEDPIEYQLARVNQVQVHPAIGLDFPQSLRAILRQDPDIIMIGEIRDAETARIAIQASLTGHLVLSTLHTNSAAAAITRLLDMGIEAFLLASTLRAVLAQRLVRRLCRACARPHANAALWQKELAASSPSLMAQAPPDLREARGCAMCDHSGFVGRTTVYELLVITPDMHEMLQSRASDSEIETAARSRGMRSMQSCGASKVWRGETSIEEVLRVTGAQ